MRRVGGRVLLLAMALISAAAAGTPGTCTIQKGLYDEWLAVSRKTPARKGVKEALLHSASSGTPDPVKQREIVAEYRSFFQCLSDKAKDLDEKGSVVFCDTASDDRLGSLVCQSLAYVKGGRTASKEFVDAFPSGRKGAEMIWELETITGAMPGARGAAAPAMFLPDGPAFRLIDELFLLVLDAKENAAARYFNLFPYASDTGAKHMDEQMKTLLREAPAVIVKEWEVIHQYQPKLKKLLAEMAASLPKAEMLKIRRQAAGFCPKDNLDCPEILKLYGRPD